MFRDGDNIVIRLAEQGSFVSGKADLQPGFLPLLEKVGKTVASGEGNVKIEGHTDNVPVIENPRFKSNWDLSGARAGSVADYFIQKVEFHQAELMCLATQTQSLWGPMILLLTELKTGESRL